MAKKDYRTYSKEDKDLKQIDDIAWKMFSDPKNKNCGKLSMYKIIGGAREVAFQREQEREDQPTM